MEPIHITVDRAADWGANRWIGYKEPQIGDARKIQILPIIKYNLLVTAFNISTVLLVAAVAFAILFAYTAAVALGSIAIFTRLTTEKELNKYHLPLQPPVAPQVQLPELPANAQPPAPVQGVGARLWGVVRNALDPVLLLRHALNQATAQEKEDNIFLRLGTRRPENWVENQVYVFDHAVWRNKVPVPEAPAAAPPVEAH